MKGEDCYRGAQGKVVGLIRGDQGGRQVNGNTGGRTMTAGVQNEKMYECISCFKEVNEDVVQRPDGSF